MAIGTRKSLTAASLVALVCAAAPAAAQDVYENAIANHGAVVRDNAILRHNLKQARDRQRGGRAAAPTNARQAEACANRARFSREYGADHPKVRQLYALCAQHGY